MSTPYRHLLNDKRWADKRQSIISRDQGRCIACGETEKLQVHHTYYEFGNKPWEYPDESLSTLCPQCHSNLEASIQMVRENPKLRFLPYIINRSTRLTKERDVAKVITLLKRLCPYEEELAAEKKRCLARAIG